MWREPCPWPTAGPKGLVVVVVGGLCGSGDNATPHAWLLLALLWLSFPAWVCPRLSFTSMPTF